MIRPSSDVFRPGTKLFQAVEKSRIFPQYGPGPVRSKSLEIETNRIQNKATGQRPIRTSSEKLPQSPLRAPSQKRDYQIKPNLSNPMTCRQTVWRLFRPPIPVRYFARWPIPIVVPASWCVSILHNVLIHRAGFHQECNHVMRVVETTAWQTVGMGSSSSHHNSLCEKTVVT